MDWAKTTARGDEKHLTFEIWCDLYKGFTVLTMLGFKFMHINNGSPGLKYVIFLTSNPDWLIDIETAHRKARWEVLWLICSMMQRPSRSLEDISIQSSHLTNTGIPIIKVRQSNCVLSLRCKFLYLERRSLYWNRIMIPSQLSCRTYWLTPLKLRNWATTSVRSWR